MLSEKEASTTALTLSVFFHEMSVKSGGGIPLMPCGNTHHGSHAVQTRNANGTNDANEYNVTKWLRLLVDVYGFEGSCLQLHKHMILKSLTAESRVNLLLRAFRRILHYDYTF